MVVNRNKKHVLVVEDDATTRAILKAQLEKLGHPVSEAENGKVAHEMLQAEHDFEIIVLDRQMPEMDGMELMKAMKRDRRMRSIPVIMQTGMDSPEEVREGLDAGVFYYLTKPVDADVLKSVLASAVREMRQHEAYQEEIHQQKTSLRLLNEAHFRFRTLEEAESLACVVAGCYKYADRVVLGLAELMINAVEHGTLGIGYEEKTHLIEQGIWRDEVNKRTELPEYKDKYVDVTLVRNDHMVSVTITDKGKGFDWQRFMEIDPERALDNHGRGIAQANAISFDRMEYNNVGNQVTAHASDNTEPEWH